MLCDKLPYDEPWGWMMPPRHALGALLLEAGHDEEALEVYRKDLAPGPHQANPKNIWSLIGKLDCLQSLSASRELNASEQRVRQAQEELAVARRSSDLGTLRGSCACATSRWARD